MATLEQLIALSQENAASSAEAALSAAATDASLEVVKQIVSDLKEQLANSNAITLTAEQFTALEESVNATGANLAATQTSLGNVTADVASVSG